MIPAKDHSSQVTPKDETHLLSVRSYDWPAICATETESSAKRSSRTSSTTYSNALKTFGTYYFITLMSNNRLRRSSATVPLLPFGFFLPSLVSMLTSPNKVLAERLCCRSAQCTGHSSRMSNSHHQHTSAMSTLCRQHPCARNRRACQAAGTFFKLKEIIMESETKSVCAHLLTSR